MFGFFPIPTVQLEKIYVVIVTFASGDWYLADVKSNEPTTGPIAKIREWTTKSEKALTFKKIEEAETVALLVCEDTDYRIGGITRKKQ